MWKRHGILGSTLAVALAMGATVMGDDPERTPQIPDLKVEKYTLPNGLEVILHEDHTTPVVGVNLWYKVGSKNEKPGRTGFAHLFEHLMFQGSKHHDSEYFGPIEKLGAQINGSTNTDRTNYFETLPSNALELALWLESDRMGFLLPALTQAKLDNQRDVVKNERRQRVDNVPYGQAGEKLDEALYPPDHPYHHSVIGSMADLSAASLDDVSAFFRTYYSPNNASLVHRRRLRPGRGPRRWSRSTSARSPAGPRSPSSSPRCPTLDGAEAPHDDRPRHARRGPSSSGRPSPRGHQDEPALDVLAAVLGQLAKENRLFRALMYDRQLAASVTALAPHRRALGHVRASTLTARPGQSLDELVTIADAEIERLKAEGPTEDEVLKAQNSQREPARSSASSRPGARPTSSTRYNVEFGDPLAYKAEMKRALRRHAGRRQAGGRTST